MRHQKPANPGPGRAAPPVITFERLSGGDRLLRVETVLPLPRDDVFPFFAAAENLQVITPPELAFQVLTPTPVAMGEGTLIDYRLRLFGLSFAWRTRITGWDPPFTFTDEQIRGPYARWIHTHTFTARGAETLMEDRVRFRLPLGWVGSPGLPLVEWQLRRIFRYRGSALQRTLLAGNPPG